MNVGLNDHRKSCLGLERSSLELQFYDLCSQVLQTECGLELYDLEYKPHSSSPFLRIYIVDPKTGTAQLDDCVRVDRALTTPMETLTWIPEGLTLEVSSPGVYRQLNSLEHFKSAVGSDVVLILKQKLASLEADADCPKAIKQAKKLRAKLLAVSETELKLDIDGYEFTAAFTAIKKANLDPTL